MTSFKVITPVFFHLFPSFLKKYIYLFYFFWGGGVGGLVSKFS